MEFKDIFAKASPANPIESTLHRLTATLPKTAKSLEGVLAQARRDVPARVMAERQAKYANFTRTEDEQRALARKTMAEAAQIVESKMDQTPRVTEAEYQAVVKYLVDQGNPIRQINGQNYVTVTIPEENTEHELQVTSARAIVGQTVFTNRSFEIEELDFNQNSYEVRAKAATKRGAVGVYVEEQDFAQVLKLLTRRDD